MQNVTYCTTYKCGVWLVLTLSLLVSYPFLGFNWSTVIHKLVLTQRLALLLTSLTHLSLFVPRN